MSWRLRFALFSIAELALWIEGQGSCTLVQQKSIMLFALKLLPEIRSVVVLQGGSDERILSCDHLAEVFQSNIPVVSINNASDWSQLPAMDKNSLVFSAVPVESSFLKEQILERSHRLHWLLPLPVGLALKRLRLDSLLFLYECVGSNIFIRETYTIKENVTITNDLSQRDSNGIWTDLAESFIWRRRSNLRGITLVDSVMDFSYFNIWSSRDGGYKGFLPDILRILRTYTNFQVQ